MNFFRWATLLWAIATLLVLGMPSGAFPGGGLPFSDKVAHTLIFACGTFLALRGWPVRRIPVLCLMLLFALLAELWQFILPTRRHVDSMDTLANIAGVIFGVGFARLIPWGRRSSE